MRSLFLLAIAIRWSVAACYAAQTNVETEPYVRISNAESNIIQLQIALRKFLPPGGKGPAVWLMGVSHIGETNYFATIQKHLAAQTLVLFEGVRDATAARETREAETSASSNRASLRPPNRFSLQSTLADSLGLAFQLTAIDYRRANFRNSDLSVQQLRQLIREQRTEATAESFDNLLLMMEGGSFWDGLLQMALRFLGSNPKLQGMSKLALVEVLGQMKGDPSRLGALSPAMKQLLEVLIEQRNQKVIDDLKTQSKALRRRDSIAIFYGTGHMPDLEKRLRGEMSYRFDKQIWLTAFSINLLNAGISESEHQFISKFIKRQLGMLQPN